MQKPVRRKRLRQFRRTPVVRPDMRIDGRQDNARRHGKLFAAVFKHRRLEICEPGIRLLGDSTAIADATLDLKHFRGLPPGIRPTIGDDVLRTRMHYVLVREGDRWSVVFSQNTAVMPLPPAG